jgi:hypothetical protein
VGTARGADVWSWLVLEIVVHNHTPLPMADGYRVVYGQMTKMDRMYSFNIEDQFFFSRIIHLVKPKNPLN